VIRAPSGESLKSADGPDIDRAIWPPRPVVDMGVDLSAMADAAERPAGASRSTVGRPATAGGSEARAAARLSSVRCDQVDDRSLGSGAVELVRATATGWGGLLAWARSDWTMEAVDPPVACQLVGVSPMLGVRPAVAAAPDEPVA
jgi:hypothetical protein